MSEVKITPEQQAVIESRGSSILVSAGAGSGKTWVLVKRLMGMINPPITGEARASISDFLIITYTKAAAAELRAKISEAISKAASDEETVGDQKDRRLHLKKQSALVSGAHIGTIHSFCTDILREYGSNVGLRPGFRVIEPEKAEALRSTVLDRVLEKHYAEPDSLPGFIELADTLGSGRDDKRLVQTILTLYDKMQCHARPELWAEKQKNAFDCDFSDFSETVWGSEIMDVYLVKARMIAREAAELVAEMEDAEDGIRKNLDRMEDVAGFTKMLADALDYENGGSWSATAALFPKSFEKNRGMTKVEDEDLAQRVKNGKASITSAVKKIGEAFAGNPEEMKRDLLGASPNMKALLEITVEFGQEYRREKKENSLVDFSDLEHYAAEILTNPDGTPTPIAEGVSKRFAEIMVDEYQDVSPVQDAIFSAVSRAGNNLFFVGDIKQSIYRFRLAEPRIFIDKLNRFRDYREPGEGPVQIPLKDNFRSRSTVVDAVNSVFTTCMSLRLGEVDYRSPGQMMTVGADYAGSAPMPELIVIENPKAQDDEETPDKLRFEAKVVADKIKKLVAEKTPVADGDDKKTLRPIQYSDFAILLRVIKNAENVFRDVLEEEGIPVSSGAETGFFSSPEISGIMSLLSIADNPHKDIPLLTVLTSSGFAFTPDELAAVRASKPKCDLYDALCAAADNDEHCRSFLDFLGELRTAAVKMPVTELVWHIICRTDMLALCSAAANGELRRERILKFVELSQRYEDSGYRGLHQFIVWTRRLKERSENPQISTSAERGVTIMSVHKSKGLEFPVVFLCNTSRKFNESNSENVLIHPELGLGPRCVDLKRRASYPSVAMKAVGLRLIRENRSEEMRLLYVALTRAKEQLYITGRVNNLERLRDEMNGIAEAGKADEETLASKNNVLPWLTAAVALDGEKHICLTKIDYDSYVKSAQHEDEDTAESASDEDTESFERELEENLSFRYPFAYAGELPSKLTATELKSMETDDDEAEKLIKELPERKSGKRLRLPDFTLSTKPLSGAERGTATHAVLQYIDFSKTCSEEDIRQEVARIEKNGFISQREAEAVDCKAILNLFSSDIGKRIANSDNVRREFRFSLLCEAEMLLRTGGDEKILLQGVVDCLIDGGDGITIIDYKTDRVFSEEEISERAAHYSSQIKAYSMAMGRVFGKPVKECVLYFLTPGKAVTV